MSKGNQIAYVLFGGNWCRVI